MAGPLLALYGAGMVLNVLGQFGAAKAQARSLNAQARAHEAEAGQSLAVASRQAAEDYRQNRLVQSRAQAVAAASGGGTGGTVEKITADIAGEGELRALTSLYEGRVEAQNLRSQAAAERAAARRARRAGMLGGLGTIFEGAASISDKFGDPSPAGPSPE